MGIFSTLLTGVTIVGKICQGITSVFGQVHMAHLNGRVCGAKRPKCEAERSHHL